MMERHSCNAVEVMEAEEAGSTEVEEAINLSKNGIGKIRNVSIAIRREIHPQFSQRQKRTTTTHLVHLGPAKKKCNEAH